MRKVCSLLFCLLFAVNSFGSPLVFKITKDFTDKNVTINEIARFDATKYRQIRILVTGQKYDRMADIEIAANLDEKNSLPLYTFRSELFLSDTVVIDTPPSELIFRTSNLGKYSIYIWASQ